MTRWFFSLCLIFSFFSFDDSVFGRRVHDEDVRITGLRPRLSRHIRGPAEALGLGRCERAQKTLGREREKQEQQCSDGFSRT